MRLLEYSRYVFFTSTSMSIIFFIYLLRKATSVDVERAFSKGGVLLTNRRNRLVGQTIRSLLCLGDWISAGIIKDKDIVRAVSGLPDIDGDEEVEMEEGWDKIAK